MNISPDEIFISPDNKEDVSIQNETIIEIIALFITYDVGYDQHLFNILDEKDMNDDTKADLYLKKNTERLMKIYNYIEENTNKEKQYVLAFLSAGTCYAEFIIFYIFRYLLNRNIVALYISDWSADSSKKDTYNEWFEDTNKNLNHIISTFNSMGLIDIHNNDLVHYFQSAVILNNDFDLPDEIDKDYPNNPLFPIGVHINWSLIFTYENIQNKKIERLDDLKNLFFRLGSEKGMSIIQNSNNLNIKSMKDEIIGQRRWTWSL